MLFPAAKGAKRHRPFAGWRIAVWLMMLLAAVGFVINTYASVVLAGAIGSVSHEAIAQGASDPRIGVAWSLAYSLAAFVVIAVALGTLRWREWGRRAMRAVALLLLVWSAYTAWGAFDQWQQLGVVLEEEGMDIDGGLLGGRLPVAAGAAGAACNEGFDVDKGVVGSGIECYGCLSGGVWIPSPRAAGRCVVVRCLYCDDKIPALNFLKAI